MKGDVMKNTTPLLTATISILILMAGCPAGISGASPLDTPGIATFSIAAHDPDTMEWGVAVQSKFLAVGSVVPFARVNVGAVATQAFGNLRYGPDGLDLLNLGVSPETVVHILTSNDPFQSYRQVGIVDANGSSAAHTGSECTPWAGHITGKNFSVQGNILTGEDVVKAMADTFKNSSGKLGERLLEALKAGQTAGGDARGRQSAAIFIVRKNGGYGGNNDVAVDMRVDDHEWPIQKLEEIFNKHAELFQIRSYLQSMQYFEAEGMTRQMEKCAAYALAGAESRPVPLNLNMVAWEFAVRDYQLEKALELAEKAVAMEPLNADIWDTVGEIHARMGRFKKAVKAEEKAVELSGGREEFVEKLEKWKSGSMD